MAQRIKSRRRKAVKKQAVHYFDYSLLAIIIFLMCFGLVMLYSISSYEARTEYGDGMYFLKRQGLIGLGSIAAMMWVSPGLSYVFQICSNELLGIHASSCTC